MIHFRVAYQDSSLPEGHPFRLVKANPSGETAPGSPVVPVASFFDAPPATGSNDQTDAGSSVFTSNASFPSRVRSTRNSPGPSVS